MKFLKLGQPQNRKTFRKKVLLLIILCILFIINLVTYFWQSEKERREYERYQKEVTYTPPDTGYIQGVLGVSP